MTRLRHGTRGLAIAIAVAATAWVASVSASQSPESPAPSATPSLERAFDWTIGNWHGTRTDAADGEVAPMTMRVEPILGGVGQLRHLEVGSGDSVYRGFTVQVPDRDGNRWVRSYTNATRGGFAILNGELVDDHTSRWTSASTNGSRQSSLVSERRGDDHWRRAMSVSDDGGATWRVLFIDDLERSR